MVVHDSAGDHAKSSHSDANASQSIAFFENNGEWTGPTRISHEPRACDANGVSSWRDSYQRKAPILIRRISHLRSICDDYNRYSCASDWPFRVVLDHQAINPPAS